MDNRYEMHGKVKIYDENHNLIQEKNNMIVKTGRLEILKLLFNKDTTTKPNFKYFYETGNTTLLTYPELSFSNIQNDVQILNIDEKNVKMTINLDDLTVVYSATITWDNSKPAYNPILAVGLVFNTDTLFSRAAIDPIYMNPGRTYLVEHTIYL